MEEKKNEGKVTTKPRGAADSADHSVEVLHYKILHRVVQELVQKHRNE